MRSIRSQFALFALCLVIIVITGGHLNYGFMIQANDAEQRHAIVSQAIETHMTGTFFNEEGRSIVHSILALHGFTDVERSQLYPRLRVNGNDLPQAFTSYGQRARDAVKSNLARPLPIEMRENFEKHLAAFEAYHAAIGRVLRNLPATKEAVMEALAELTVLRTRVGDIRKVNTEALAKAAEAARADRDSATAMQERVLLATFGAIVLTLGAFVLYMRRQFGNFSMAVNAALENFKGNRPVAVEIRGIAKLQEFKAVASSLEELQRKGAELVEAQAREARALSQRADRATSLEAEVAAFEATVSEVVGLMRASATAMRASAQQVHRTTSAAELGAAALTESSRSADDAAVTVAGATTEMATAVDDLVDRLSQTVDVVSKASVKAEETKASVERLHGAATKIGEVVSLIRSIAGQTNLLALNATIEAARAGDSGRGFAVVAGEVKNLATHTSQATEEIAAQIAAIQENTGTAVDAIRTIAEAVNAAAQRTQDMSAVLGQQDGAIRIVSQTAETSQLQTSSMLESAGAIEGWIKEANESALRVEMISGDLDKASQDIDAAVRSFLKRVAA